MALAPSTSDATVLPGNAEPASNGGMIEQGNIDLAARPVVRNEDGSISTVRSMSFSDDSGAEIVIPTVSDDGRIMSDEEAVDTYYKTGKFLGKFDSTDAAISFANSLHEQQADMYLGDDASDQYLSHREDGNGANELMNLMRRVEARDGIQTPDQQPSGQGPDATPAGNVTVRRLTTGGYGAYVDGNLVAGGASPEEAMEAGLLSIASEGVMDRVGDVASDIGGGVIEAPRQAVGGAVDAVRETTNAIDDLAAWLNENVADLDITIPLPGVEEGEEFDLTPTTLIESVLPEIDEARTTTGNVVRNVAQFVTGFWGAGKFLRGAGLPTATTAAGRAGTAMGQGAIADFTVFDPSEERLSNIIQDVPELENPINEFLAAREGDTEIEGRLKNALEGAGLGALTDAFVLSLRGLKNMRAARNVSGEEAALREQAEKFGSVTSRDFMLLGDPDSVDIVISRPTAKGMIKDAANEVPPVTAEELLSGQGQGDVMINWARIDSPDDIKKAMQAMADLSKEGIDTARRGVRSNEATKAAAAQTNAWDVLVSRREGQPLNAEDSVALRQLWASATETLTEAAKRAAAEPGEANLFAFRKMLAVQDAIQKQVIAARTETARALQSWSIPAGGNIERARAVQDIINTTAEDPEVHRELARRLAALGEAGEFDKMNEVARRSVTARTYDAVVQAWINGLLSGPKTHLVNMMSNTSVIFASMAERETAARIAALMGDDGSVQMGEAVAQWFGMVQGLKDSFRISSDAEKMGTVWQSIRTGQSGFGLQKIDVPRQGALGSDVWNVASDTALGRTLDAMNVVTQIPGRALGAEDELFKTIGYRMELNAQALRQARSDVSAGKIPETELKSRVADIIANPPQHIRLAAIDAATYQTFNSAPGKISQTLMKYRNSVPVLGPLTAPFVRTVGNVMKYTFERTPLAPVMGQVRADIAAGGARRDLALARIALGSSVMALSADLALSGQISGKGPADSEMRATERRAGMQPYSVKVGDRWYAYNRMDPIGTLLGISADMVDILANGDITDDKWNEDVERAVIATAAAIGSNMMNKTYLTGMSDFVEAMSDPIRNSEYWAQGVAGSFVPTLSGEFRRADDPYMREVRSLWDAIRNKTPGLSEELPLRRDLWGRPISYRSGLGATYDAFSPIYSRKEEPEPIDTELLRLGNGPAMMPRRTSFNGATINLDQYEGAYSRMVELAGNETKLIKYGNMGAKDALNAIIEGRSPFSAIYKMRTDGPDGGKMQLVRAVVAEYREAAKKQMMAEYPQIAVEVQRKLDSQSKWMMQR